MKKEEYGIMKVAICDDNNLMCKQVEEIVNSYFDGVAETVYFSSPAKIIKTIEFEEIYDILITDIDLKSDINGIELAKTINKKLPGCKIIFLTGYIDYVSEVYETSHTYFVLKDSITKELPNALKKAVNEINSHRHILFNQTDSEKIIIDIKEIEYIEHRGRKCSIHTKKKIFEIYAKINDLICQLPEPRFVQCHASYIINFDFLNVYKNKTAYLTNGAEIPVSRNLKNKVEDTLVKYIKTQK